MQDSLKQNSLVLNFWNTSKILNALLIVVILSYVALLIKLIFLQEILPHESDEILFYQSSLMIGNYNSLKASIVLDELVSKIFAVDYYGPGYPLFFGTIYKLMCHNQISFIYTNFILLIGTIFILFKMQISLEDKKWISLILLLSTPILIYIFYFMPCILDLLFASMLIYHLQLIDQNHDTRQ